MTVVVLLGAPGAGKGTQAAVLRDRLGIPHIATGDLFRAAIREGTPLGLAAKSDMDAGRLVPDDLTIAMLIERLDRPDAARGAILDGFPRTRAQAEALERLLATRGTGVDAALLIEVPTEELVARLSGRWICRSAGHPFHAITRPPRTPGICDLDGSELYQRDDDREETVRARLATQLGALGEVVDHYRTAGLLHVVDGRRDIDAVTAALLAALPAASPAGS